MTDYAEDFFATLNDAGASSARAVLRSAFELLRPSSVVDIGCGTGIWTATALGLGLGDVLGVDGDYVPRHQLQLPLENFRVADLSRTFDLGRRFDVAICVEVAEHLDASRADGFVDDLCAHADALVFGAATPKQGGTHHVNEQWPDYWIAHFARHGYTCWDLVRPQIRYDPRVAWIYRQNVMVVLGPTHPLLTSLDPTTMLRCPEDGDVCFEYVARYIVEREDSAKVALARAGRNRLARTRSAAVGRMRRRGHAS